MTADLLKYDMRMPPERIHPLPMDEPVTIDGVTVTLMGANHCPGAVMMLFQVPLPGSKVQVGSPAYWTSCTVVAWEAGRRWGGANWALACSQCCSSSCPRQWQGSCGVQERAFV